MTEDEAKTKWCPFVRYSSAFDDYAANRWKQGEPADELHALNPVPCRCIASTCMAWRWNDLGTLERRLPPGELPVPDAKTKGWECPTTTLSGKVLWLKKLDKIDGFCGLAGKP